MKSTKSLMVYTAVLGSFGLLLRSASMELRYRAYFATRKAGGGSRFSEQIYLMHGYEIHRSTTYPWAVFAALQPKSSIF